MRQASWSDLLAYFDRKDDEEARGISVYCIYFEKGIFYLLELNKIYTILFDYGVLGNSSHENYETTREGLVKRGQDWLRIRVPIFGRGEEGGLVLWRLRSPCYAIRKLGWWSRCSRYCLNTASRNVIRLLIAPLTTRWITTVRQKLLKTYDFFTDSFSNSETPLSFFFLISFTCSYVSNRRRIGFAEKDLGEKITGIFIGPVH